MLCSDPFESVYIVHVLLLSLPSTSSAMLIALSSADKIEALQLSAFLPGLKVAFVLLGYCSYCKSCSHPSACFGAISVYVHVCCVFVV